MSLTGRGTRYGTFVPPYAQGCDLSWTYSNVVVCDRPQPWAYRYFLFPYHISVYIGSLVLRVRSCIHMS